MDAVEGKKLAIEMADWLKGRGIDFDDAAPVMAMTLGLIVGAQARGNPSEENIRKGVEILRDMIMVSAVFKATGRDPNEVSEILLGHTGDT